MVVIYQKNSWGKEIGFQIDFNAIASKIQLLMQSNPLITSPYYLEHKDMI